MSFWMVISYISLFFCCFALPPEYQGIAVEGFVLAPLAVVLLVLLISGLSELFGCYMRLNKLSNVFISAFFTAIKEIIQERKLSKNKDVENNNKSENEDRNLDDLTKI